MSFTELLAQLMLGAPESEQQATEGAAAFGTFLNAQQQIRVYVDNTPNMGHQATTIHLLKRLIDLYHYTGQVRIVWAPTANEQGGINDTARKLGLLLTGLDPRVIDDATIAYGSCQDIQFIKASAPGDKLNARVAFGVTGGADDLTANYAQTTNVTAFLRLQPFAWRLENGSFVPSQIEFHPDDGRATVRIGDLSNTINLLPYKFDAAAVTTVSPAVWDWYCGQDWNPTLATSTGYARSLLTASTDRGAPIWPAYGLHQFDVSEMLLNIAVIGGSYQKSLGFQGPPIVIPLLNKFDANNFRYLDPYISGADGSTDTLNNRIKEDYGYDLTTKNQKINFNKFLTQLDKYKEDNHASANVKLLKDGFTAETVSQEINSLNNGEILMVAIGSVPQDVYNCLFTSPLPPLFEGQGTSSLVISLGTPYFQMPKQGKNGNNYPSAPPVDLPAGLPTRCNQTAEKIRLSYNNYLMFSPAADLESNVDSIVSFMNDLNNAHSDLSAYFQGLLAYYSQDIHDKLTLGLIAYQSQTAVQQEPNIVALSAPSRTRLSVEEDSTTTLAGIYDSLTAAWSDGTLDLLAAMAGSEFADFWRPVVGSTFLVTVALEDITETKDDDGEVTEVSVADASTLAFGTPFSLGLVFTAPNKGPILSRLSCRATQVWSIDGAPWIQFADPGFDLTVTEALTPVQGGLVGTVVGGATLAMEIRYPVEENRWVVTGVFEAPYPSIGSFFQMAGGLNLVQSLPSPLNALSGFGLREAQFVYNQTDVAIDYLTFTFSTDSPWILLKDPAIALTPTVVYTITAPGDLANRSWKINATGEFTIGAGTVTISTQYPEFQVSGALTDGQIMIADLVKLLGAVLDVDAAVTGFNFYVYPTTGFFGVTADALLQAPVTIGDVTLFELETLGVDTSGGDGRYVVTLRGTTVILPETAAEFSLSLSATFELPGAWTFAGQQTDGTSVSLTALLDYYLGWDTGSTDPYGIAGLALSFDTGTGAWSFEGGTDGPWSVPFIPDIKVAGRFNCGSRASEETDGKLESYGRIDLDWLWNGIALTVWYDYQPGATSFGITWGMLSGTVSYDAKTGEYTSKLGFTDTVTVGSLIATMIEWLTGSSFTLEAPWDVVNQISLSGVSLVYVFNPKDSSRNRVSFDLSIGPLDLGFARIDSISASYLSKGEDRGVNVSLKGLFTWNIGDGAQGDTGTLGPWDASEPGAAPAPPGQGNKYLDLRMMALGQRVTVKGLTDATTVQDAIALMTTLPDPSPGTLPPLVFDAASDWMVGLDFGVLKLSEEEGAGDTGTGYFLTLQTVFNDPNFYALRLALDGSMAKVFKGLDFQIIYRQISDTVGVYSAQIALPTIMRRIDVGAYTITLPEFAISVYTNGDFQIDVGFPWNNDFSRSFTVEAIIPPGIPMLGSGGFYFGKLSSATTSLVPVATNGTFNPVLVFGFGLQLGLGKSVEYGILSASFSLTVFGILEGVLATWNPYDGAGSTLPAGQLQGAYYFKLSGTLGILGKLDGSVDFGIIKASVSVEIAVMVQLAYESFVSMTFTVLASVKVKASVRINLGLFKITLHFSFSMRVKESFTVANTGTPPWQVAATTTTQTASLLSRPAALRTSALRKAARPAAQSAERTLLATAESGPTWTNLQPADRKAPLSGYTAMGLTGARNEWPDDSTQTPCWVAMLFIDSVAPSDGTTTSTDTGDTSFEALAKAVARWVIAAIQPAPLTSDQVDALVIAEADLDALLDTTLVSTDDNPTPIPIDAIDPFFDGQFVMTVALPPDEDGSATATYFPMPGAVTMTVPAYGADYDGVSYAFGDYNAISSAGLAELRAYFNALAVQSEESGDTAAMAARNSGTDDSTSMAEWIRSDYMLLIARQMIQAMRDGLRDFTHPIDAATTPQALVESVNSTGQLFGDAAVSVADLFTANPTHALAAGKTLGIGTILTAPVPSPSFNDLALDYAADGVTGSSLATANAAAAGILTAGAVVSWPGHEPATCTVTAGDTLYDIADAFDALLADLLSEADVLDQPGLPASGAALLVPLITASALSGDSFTTIAQREPFAAGGLTPAALALANAGSQILRTGAKVAYPDKAPVTVEPRQGLGDVAHSLGVSLDDLLAKSGVLTQTDLLATVAVLALPVLAIVTADGDTLTDIAARYGTTAAALGTLPANRTIAGLFALTDASGTDIGTLDLPHLPRYQVAALIDEAQRSQAIANLSGMASRYYLQGLRLPTDGITPNTAGMWVRDIGGTLTLPPFAGLFALTGQQIPLPAAITATPFTVELTRAAGPAWLHFADAAGATVDTLSITVAAGSADADRITSIAACLTAPLDIPLLALGTGAVAQSTAATYPLSSMTAWLSADLVDLPNGIPGDGNQTLRLWTLPDSLTALPDPATRRIDPRFAIILSRYDEASGSTVDGPVGAYGWASAIAFTVRKVPAIEGSPASATTYEVIGADDEGIVILERLLDQLQSDNGAIASLRVAFVMGGGLQSDAEAAVTMGISQANLSTQTNPPASMTARALTATATTGLGLLNTKLDFLRLLWEASITRSGGFYLYYYDQTDARGLPDDAFNDKGEASLTAMVLYAAPVQAAQQNRLTDYMNAVVTGGGFDIGSASVNAKADPQTDPPLTVTATAADTLADLAYGYFANLGDLAEANAGLALTAGTVLTVSEGLYQPPPGSPQSLASIATRFGTSVAALQAANGGTLPDPAAFPLAIRLPTLSLTAGTSTHSASLEDIAGWYGMDVVALASHNRSVAGLWTGRTVVLPEGPVTVTGTVDVGTAALLALREVPPEEAATPASGTDTAWATAYLLNDVSLLGCRIYGNADFTESPVSLPFGPTSPDDDTGGEEYGSMTTAAFGKVAAPEVATAGEPDWEFRQNIPYSSYARTGSGDSPYDGVGGILQVTFSWQDLYGNQIDTTLSEASAGSTGPYNQPPVIVGYTDALLGLGQWPTLSSNWLVESAEGGGARITLTLSFAQASYDGLLMAVPQTATTVLATFTQPLDPAGAASAANYSLTVDDGSVSLDLTSAVLQPGGLSVLLTLASAFADGDVAMLTVNGLTTATGDGVSGWAGFSYPDAVEARGSGVQSSAAQAQRTYSSLRNQLNDPNGISLGVSMSLLVDEDGSPLVTPLSADEVTALKTWLFDGTGGTGGTTSILAFVTDRATFGTGVAAPPPAQEIALPITASSVTQAQIVELQLTFTVTRTGGSVWGDLQSVAGIRSASTIVPPLTKGDTSSSLALSAFAAAMEEALSQPGSFLIRVATGADRTASVSTADNSVWAVRVGESAGQAISYALSSPPDDPAIFAPRPVSNRLESRSGVPIYRYSTGQGLSQTGVPTDFTNVDMDSWTGQLFAAVDAVLTPKFLPAIQILDKLSPGGRLETLLDYKDDLAAITSELMEPVYADQAGADPADAREAFYQELLAQLSNAYTVKAALGFTAAVSGAVTGDEVPPRLYGATAVNPQMTAATVAEESARSVTVWFSTAMAADQAGSPGSYTLSGGLEVVGAVIASDGQSVTLSLNGDVEAGTTTVTVDGAVTDTLGWPIQPPLTMTVTSGASTPLASTLSLSAPKLSLETAAAQPLTVMVSAPGILHDDSGAAVSEIELNLRYYGSSIEHQIGSLSGIENYEASSWLSFVISQPSGPLTVDLGRFPVPMVLRSFPTTPDLPAQTATGTPQADADELSEILVWTLDATYSLPYHYPQDRVHATVEFNIASPMMAFASFLDAFNALAQFVTVFPSVQADLDTWLAGIDASIDAADAEGKLQIDNAATALDSMLQMVGGIVEASGGGGSFRVASSAPSSGVGDPSLSYSFTVAESSVDYGQTRDALLVSIVGAPPDGIGVPAILVAPDSYEAVRVDGTAADTYSYVYRRLGTGNDYLPASDGQSIADRTIELPGMNILQRQDAQTSVYLTRNEELVAGRPSASSFVYTTPDVTFANPVLPSVDWAQAIDIAAIGSSTGPVSRTLTGQLANLFTALLTGVTLPTLSIQVRTVYSYAKTSFATVELPVFMQAPLSVTISGTGEGTLDAMIEAWAGAISLWFATNLPSGTDGRLAFDLRIMSDLTRQTMPLVHLGTLTLDLDYVQPPLPTAG
ncbi:LysM peptidoglycan-binding domain-containing protein [Azospirillum sp. HJ39]|uniref:LysM peptidoglycan-binding domain-containing protein n=1 Tax=Azospirillum sp. HJ39 TaxID=3159496 RepID=UPI0035579AB3